MGREDRFANAYVAALGLAAVYLTSANGRIRLAASGDPEGAFARLQKRDASARMEVIGWCRPDRAELLKEAVRFEFGGRFENVGGLHSAAAEVRSIADQLGVVLQTDDEIRAGAKAAAAHIDRVFNEKLGAGELRDLNRRYRAERLARTAQGARMPSYAQWLYAQKLALVRATAEAAASVNLLTPC